MGQLEFLLPILIVAGVAGLIAAVVVLSLRAEKRRTEAMCAAAESLGLPFLPKGDPSMLAQWSSFELFSHGGRKRLKNMIHGETDEVEAQIFEYRYTTGGGESSHTWRQTVISFHARDLNLPRFVLRPAGFFDRVGSALGRRDIHFDSHPVFSQKYVLRGREEKRIRNAFRDEVLTHCESQNGISAEGEGQRLIFYRAGKVVPPDQIRSFMEEGFRVFSLFRSAPSLHQEEGNR